MKKDKDKKVGFVFIPCIPFILANAFLFPLAQATSRPAARHSLKACKPDLQPLSPILAPGHLAIPSRSSTASAMR